MPAAAWVSSISPPGPLYIVVALLVLASLVISVALVRVHTTVDGRAAQVITGIGSGLGTVLGGVGGPAVTVYAVLSRWQIGRASCRDSGEGSVGGRRGAARRCC